MLQEELTVGGVFRKIELREWRPDRNAPPLPPKVLGKNTEINQY